MKNSTPAFLKKVTKALDGKKGVDIKVLKVGGLVYYTDHIILCSGTSGTHVNALVSEVKDLFHKEHVAFFMNASKDNSWWILDAVDIVVHVFKEDARQYYDLEGLWADAVPVKP